MTSSLARPPCWWIRNEDSKRSRPGERKGSARRSRNCRSARTSPRSRSIGFAGALPGRAGDWKRDPGDLSTDRGREGSLGRM